MVQGGLFQKKFLLLLFIVLRTAGHSSIEAIRAQHGLALCLTTTTTKQQHQRNEHVEFQNNCHKTWWSRVCSIAYTDECVHTIELAANEQQKLHQFFSHLTRKIYSYKYTISLRIYSMRFLDERHRNVCVCVCAYISFSMSWIHIMCNLASGTLALMWSSLLSPFHSLLTFDSIK